ncbi:conjugal transfer protein [Streptomyces sp. NPDC057909]|uniref:conjugal transfer protein n=1 Tax=Streptomyces sp. NPDC057909 TaxID=3346277 RepID=UPI0036E03257
MNKQLTRGQIIVLAAATVPMIGAGAAGGWGTYTNITAEFHRAATALGVVAAGEGVTLVLALVMVGLTMLGQAAPAPVRAGLWIAPIAAAVTGIVVADDATEAVVYAMTPMAMSASAEGLGLLARRIVVHRTGVDMEVQRRNAETLQRLAYHQARAANHPSKGARKRSLSASWRLAARVGEDDAELGVNLVHVQRERLTDGADAALAGMFTVGAAAAAAEVRPAAVEPKHSATEVLRRSFAEMDPADAIRIAHDARPDTPPAELASLLITYGVIVDAVQVALVLGGGHPLVTVERGDTDDAPGDAPQVTNRPALTKTQAIVNAQQALGPDVTAAEIVDHVQRISGINTDENYVRTVRSREAKKRPPNSGGRPMEGGYA